MSDNHKLFARRYDSDAKDDKNKILAEIICEFMNHMSPAEQRVAHFLLGSDKSIDKLSCTEIAHSTNVSKPTVVRFCQKMGFNGIGELRQTIEAKTHGARCFAHDAVHDFDRNTQVFKKINYRAICDLINFQKSLSDSVITEVNGILYAAYSKNRQIDFFGFNAKDFVAQEAQQKFSAAGCRTSFVFDFHQQAMRLNNYSKDDVVIIFSGSIDIGPMKKMSCFYERSQAKILFIGEYSKSKYFSPDAKIDLSDDRDYFGHLSTTSRIIYSILIDSLLVNLSLLIGYEAISKNIFCFDEIMEICQIALKTSRVGHRGFIDFLCDLPLPRLIKIGRAHV